MAVTPNLNLPLLDSGEKISEDHLKINQFVEALDARLGEFAATISGLASVGHSHDMSKVTGLAEALELRAASDHSHKLDDLADVNVKDAPNGKILQKIAGKWGLGDRGYSVPEINALLEEQTALTTKFADTTQSVKFNHGVAVAGDFYLNNKAIISNDSQGEFNDRSGDNIDHIYHDDSGNAWHFVSDNSYKSRGNSKLNAGQVDLFRNDLTTNATQYMLKARNHSNGQENLTANRTSTGIYAENYVHAPLNGSKDDGRRFYSVGARFNAYLTSETGYAYEVVGSLSTASHRGKGNLRYLTGAASTATTTKDTEGEIEHIWGGRSRAILEGATCLYVTGHEIHVNPDHANTTVDYAEGLRISMNHDGGTVTKDPVALHMNYDGSWSGKKKIGVWQNEVDENRFTGTSYFSGHEVVHAGNLAEKAEDADIVGVKLGPVQYGSYNTSSSDFANNLVYALILVPENCVVVGISRTSNGRGVRIHYRLIQ